MKGDKTFCWVIAYITCVLFYIPFAVSFSLGTIAAVHLLYPNAAKAEEFWHQRRSISRLHPVVVGLLCVFPQILTLVCGLLPSSFNKLTSFMMSDGRFFVYPGPLFLLLPIMPIAVVWHLYGFRVPRLRNLFPPRIICLLALVTILCVFPLAYYWYDIARNCRFNNPWLSIHFGLKSFYYNGLWEELHYRFLLIPVFRSYFKKNTSILLTSLLFTLTHFETAATFLITWNPNSLIVLGGIFLLGLGAGHCFYITKSIIPCVVLHGFCSGSTKLVGGIGKLLLLH